MTDPTNRERQARYFDRMSKQGMVKACEWIPAECHDTLKRIAREMRDGFGGAPVPEHEPPPDDISDRVLEAHRWGWAPNAIAAYLGISVERVEQILEEK